ncbi:DUF1800 domain-containing protein [Paracoccaceae bacterium GXU_MW_L88]
MSAPSFETVAAIRFGYGFAPDRGGATRPEDLLADLAGPDEMAARYPSVDTKRALRMYRRAQALSQARRKSGDGADQKAYRQKAINNARQRHLALRTAVARIAAAPNGFRERLVAFWMDHFTTRVSGAIRQPFLPAFIEDAIRPNISGSFQALLRAATLHPAMLISLDQGSSIGPNSPAGVRADGRGLNENLARELMELHTVGVGGSYSQTDVRELAKLLTGLIVDPNGERQFAPNRAEPGSETVLGQSYGGGEADLSHIHAVLDDLAIHPETAQHLARKLAVHFISDTPPEDLVSALAARFTETGGDLMQVYHVLLTHPAATETFGEKVKQPFDFVASSCRALGMSADALNALSFNDVNRRLFIPVRKMGQPWLNPAGPDGWPEEADYWTAPQLLSERITWSMQMPRIMFDQLPDPRAFVETALGELASPTLTFAARGAETRRDGVGVILSSPQFNRR